MKHDLQLHQVRPRDVSDYFESRKKLSIPSKKLYRSTFNHFFHLQFLRHAVVLNPTSAVKNERWEVAGGKTLSTGFGAKSHERLLPFVGHGIADSSTQAKIHSSLAGMIFKTELPGTTASPVS